MKKVAIKLLVVLLVSTTGSAVFAKPAKSSSTQPSAQAYRVNR